MEKQRETKRHFGSKRDNSPLDAGPTWSPIEYLRMDANFVKAVLSAMDSGLETCRYTSNSK
jgi:hypothetical protein